MAIRPDDVDLARDRELVRRYQDGDAEAFAELYDRYFERLRRYCERRAPNGAVAEELAQEAFVRALRALPALDGEQRFYPWLTVIARRLCIDDQRRHGRLTVVDLREPVEETAPLADPQEVVAREIDLEFLERALGEVNPRHREVLRLREVEGLSYRDIAEKLGLRVSTVEALLFRARKALQREFRLLNDRSKLLGAAALAALQRSAARLRVVGSAPTEHGVVELSSLGQTLAALAAAFAITISGAGENRDPAPAPAAESARPVPIARSVHQGEGGGTTAVHSAVEPQRVASSREPTNPPASSTTTTSTTPVPAVPPLDDVELGSVPVRVDPEDVVEAENEIRRRPVRRRVENAGVGARPEAIFDRVDRKRPRPPGWERRPQSGGNASA